MKVATIIPIKKVSHDTLSYFTSKEIEVGSIVEIPIRGKSAFGLVIHSRDAEDLKAEIKSLPYSIKKIEEIKSFSFVREEFVEAVKKIADYNAGTYSSTLAALTSKIALEESKNLWYEKKGNFKQNFHETVLLQSDDEERFSNYRSCIREEFAKNKSVFFCLPTTEDTLNSKEILEKGIESFTYILHSGLPKKDLVETWKKILEEKHPVLIIATPQFLSLPKEDLGTIILEKESSRNYKLQVRPYLDFRIAVEEIAKYLKVKLILGDKMLRIETIWNEKNGKYAPLSPLKFRSLSKGDSEVINLRTPQDMKDKKFEIIGEKLKKLIIETKENNERIFLFCARKGLYPSTVCSDCGRIVVCNNCNSPVVLYGKNNSQGKNLFVCHHCGERRDAQELCKYCGGWRLIPLGIGVEKVVEEIKSFLPNSHVVIMDKDHVKTHKQAVKKRDEFYNKPGSIMIGTELALTYLNQKLENSAIVSIDSYFSIPDFQINEKIFQILLSLKSVVSKKFLIQTRQENTKIFDYAASGNLVDFYREEIEDRKATGYPPFATYIKISLTGEKVKIKKMMEEVKNYLNPYSFEIYDAFNPGSNKNYTVHGLIGLDPKKWIDYDLLNKLKVLPPSFSIKVDPMTLL